MIAEKQSGIVEFKSQKDIIADRQKKTKQEYKNLQKRIEEIIKANHYLSKTDVKTR